MESLIIKLKKEIIKKNEMDIVIGVESAKEEDLEYRFFESYNGSWKMLKDYGEDNTCQYNMKNENRCFIMVQGRKHNSTSAFDYVERIEYFKKDDKSYIKKVSFMANKQTTNKELMNFQEIQKRNFEKFEEKMKQKSMEDMFDPLKQVYEARENDNEETNENDDKKNDTNNRELDKSTIIVKTEPVNDEFKEREIEPEEVITIVEEEQPDNEITEELTSDNDEIEIVQDTSIVEMEQEENNNNNDNDEETNENNAGKDEIEIVDNTSYTMEAFSESNDNNESSEEGTEFIPNYDDLVSEAEKYATSPEEQQGLNDFNHKEMVEEVSKDIDQDIRKESKAIEKNTLEDDEQFFDEDTPGESSVELEKNNKEFAGQGASINSEFNGIRNKISSVNNENSINKISGMNSTINSNGIHTIQGANKINNENTFNRVNRINSGINKFGNDKFVDKTLEQLDHTQNRIQNQINDMYFEREITLPNEGIEEIFIEAPKEELIKYILTSPRKNYYKGSQIVCTLLCPKPNDVSIKYELYLNEKLISEKPYSMEKTYAFTPPYEGTYRLVFSGKKADSNSEFKKEKEILVAESLPIESVGISCDKSTIICNEPVTFMTTVVGGKNVLYEFYIFAHNQWQCVQEYSETSYFTLTPQRPGTYKLLIMAKNNNSQNDYDEFVMCKFDVKNQFSNLTDISSLNL